MNDSSAAVSDVARTKILLLGLRRSGKSSIQKVLFESLAPKETFYLEPNSRIVKKTYDTVIPLEIWDCPGNITVDTLGTPLSHFRTIIFVIDIRDLYNQAITKLVEFVIAAYEINPNVHFEVFVHKVENLQEEDKVENFRQINERVTDRLIEYSPEYEQLPLAFQMTSVYDHSLHQAFSRVLLKLIGSLPYLEDLLNVFCANSQSPKAYLFDIQSRLYIATDASPVNTATHELCCDYLQMLNSFGPLYRSASASGQRHKVVIPQPPPEFTEEGGVADRHTARRRRKEVFYPSAAALLHSTHPGTTLTYHLITEHLALLALMQTPVFESKRGLIEYNVVFFREGVQEIYEVEQQVRSGG